MYCSCILITVFFCCCYSFGMSNLKIAIVTGANKGIGFEIAKKIVANGGYKTILACRSEQLGRQAEQNLKSSGLNNVEFRQVDIGEPSTFGNFVAGLERDYGKVDVLVNNAAIYDSSSLPDAVGPTLKINYFGTVLFTDAILPLLKKSTEPRLVNVASQLGHLNIITSPTKKEKFASADSTLTFRELNELMTQFQTDVIAGTSAENGWPKDTYVCYSVSKVGLIAATKILARQEPNILINACCPGYCDTDLNNHTGPRSAEHGARTPAMLVLSANERSTGKFFADEKIIDW